MDIDVIYLNGWVALFQFLFCLPLMFPSAAMINLPMDEIWPNFVAGYRCWGGVNTVVEGNDLGLPPDDCAMAPLYVNLYLILNIVYNLLIVIILKHGSANIMWMASTVIVPMSNFAFSLDIMPHHQPMKVADLVGLFVIMIGLVVYRFTALLQSTWAQLTGRLTKEDIERQRITDKYESKIERKQMRFVVSFGSYLMSPPISILDVSVCCMWCVGFESN